MHLFVGQADRLTYHRAYALGSQASEDLAIGKLSDTLLRQNAMLNALLDPPLHLLSDMYKVYSVAGFDENN